MVRTSSASSELTGGRPGRPRRDFQVQKARKPCRCQRITVSGPTRWSASRHPAHRLESHTQKARSTCPNCGRFDRRWSRASCCRRAKFSSARSERVLSAARRAPNEAITRNIAAMAPTPLAHRPALGQDFGKRQPSFELVPPRVWADLKSADQELVLGVVVTPFRSPSQLVRFAANRQRTVTLGIGTGEAPVATLDPQ
jgi:hypothetical protein